MIPSVEECYNVMEKYGMLENIRAHSVVVERIAVVIGRGLRDAGVDISLEKISAGALMHDIGKTPTLGTGDDHAAKGRDICLQYHFDEIADIVGEHIRLQNFKEEGKINEKEVVYYADKRVNDDAVVSLEERLKYLIDRYAGNQKHLSELIKENFDLCKKVQGKLFERLHFGPEDLPSMI